MDRGHRRVELDADTVVDRDVVVHPGAVGVVALDADDQVVVLRQYRHPVAAHLWEIPAGLLDEPGESPWSTAQRELVEEAGLMAVRVAHPGRPLLLARHEQRDDPGLPGPRAERGRPGRPSAANRRGTGPAW